MKIIHSNIIGKDFDIHRAVITCRDGKVDDVRVCHGDEFPNNICAGDEMSDCILLPWLFNAHCHLGESLYEISKEEMSGMTISRYVEITENINRNLDADSRGKMWKKSARLTAVGQISNCISGICAARCADICNENRLLAMTGYPIMDSVKLKGYMRKGIRGFTDYMDKCTSPQVSVGLFFHSLYVNGKDELELAREAMEHGSEFISVHVSEDLPTRQKETEKLGMSPIEALRRYNLLCSHTLVVHGGYLSDDELQLIKEANAGIVVCPVSNITLNTMMPDLYKIRRMGIRWCLATDGLATGKTFSLIKQADTLSKAFPELTAGEIYQSITITPASFFDRPCYTGWIEKGVESRFIAIKKRDTLSKSIEGLFDTEIINSICIC